MFHISYNRHNNDNQRTYCLIMYNHDLQISAERAGQQSPLHGTTYFTLLTPLYTVSLSSEYVQGERLRYIIVHVLDRR